MTLIDAVVVFVTLFVLGAILKRRDQSPVPGPCEWHKWSYVEGLYTCGTCGKVAGHDSDTD